jgi:nucleoid-associated protein YejK
VSAILMNNQEVDIESKDPVIEQLVAELRRRSEFGLKKYGVPLSREDLTLKDWLRHALEETLDKAGYLQAAINSLESGQRPADSGDL